MLELGVDEATLVLQLNAEMKAALVSSEWERWALEMISTFEKKSRFCEVFGKRRPFDQKPLGYTQVFTYGEHGFYLAVGYHEFRSDMGVVAKLSAQALEYYLQKTESQFYGFLQELADGLYTLRLSRIDLVADFIDEEVDTTDIYKKLVDGEIVVATKYTDWRTGSCSYRKSNVKVRGFAVGSDILTTYLGSVQSNSEMRIYDKRTEQIKRGGSKYDKAMSCESWTRFEAVFRNEYAHQLMDALLKVRNDDELGMLIASSIVQKYRLMDIENGVPFDDIPCSRKLMEATKGAESNLRAPRSRTFDIVRSLGYLVENSGTLTTLYKVYVIWGSGALDYMMKFLTIAVKNHEPNTDCLSWLNKNKDDSFASHPKFKALVSEYIAPLLESKKR